jgi:hypothetical protein
MITRWELNKIVKQCATLFLEIRVRGIASKEQMAKREAMIASLAGTLDERMVGCLSFGKT